jgi:hypothetical protein
MSPDLGDGDGSPDGSPRRIGLMSGAGANAVIASPLASRARIIAGLFGFLTVSQFRDGPDR